MKYKHKSFLKSKGGWIGAVIGILSYFLDIKLIAVPQMKAGIYENLLRNLTSCHGEECWLGMIILFFILPIAGFLIGYFIERMWRRR